MSWPAVPLQEVAKIERSSVKPEEIPSGTSYLGLEHIESGGAIIGFEEVEKGDLASNKFAFGPRHILYGKLRPYLAKIALPDFEGICSTDILPVLPSQRVDRSYLAHFLRQPAMVDYASSRSTGANLPRLSPKSLAEFPIPLPPLEEQRRIAGILDQADALRRLRTRALDKLNTLGQAIFHEMFGDMSTGVGDWPVARLEDHVIDAQIGAVRGAKEMDDSLPVAYLRMDSIGRDGSLRLSDLKRVEASEKDTAKYALQTGDLLFNTRNTRELVGKTAVVREAFGGIYNNNILRCRFSDGLSADFVDAFFRTQQGRNQLGNIKSGTTSVFAIYQKAFMALEVPTPPTELQNDFSRRLARLHANRQPLNRSAAELAGLFASLQHRAFQGEL